MSSQKWVSSISVKERRLSTQRSYSIRKFSQVQVKFEEEHRDLEPWRIFAKQLVEAGNADRERDRKKEEEKLKEKQKQDEINSYVKNVINKNNFYFKDPPSKKIYKEREILQKHVQTKNLTEKINQEKNRSESNAIGSGESKVVRTIVAKEVKETDIPSKTNQQNINKYDSNALIVANNLRNKEIHEKDRDEKNHEKFPEIKPINNNKKYSTEILIENNLKTTSTTIVINRKVPQISIETVDDENNNRFENIETENDQRSRNTSRRSSVEAPTKLNTNLQKEVAKSNRELFYDKIHNKLIKNCFDAKKGDTDKNDEENKPAKDNNQNSKSIQVGEIKQGTENKRVQCEDELEELVKRHEQRVLLLSSMQQEEINTLIKELDFKH